MFKNIYFGIISRGRRCESCVWGCRKASGWLETGITSVFLGFMGVFGGAMAFWAAAVLLTTVFFTGLLLLEADFAVFGTVFFGVEGFLTVFGVFFAAICFFAVFFITVVSFFMVSPFSVLLLLPIITYFFSIGYKFYVFLLKRNEIFFFL